MTGFVEMFDATLFNLKVGSERAQVIRNRRDEITKALNKGFRDTESAQNNRLMVGSWGRNTAINGVSDLDMIYVLPESLRDETRRESGAEKILSKTRDYLRERYPATNIKVDHLVVVVQFADFKFEVQPCFENEDGSFDFPDTYAKTWKRTDPRSEIKELQAVNDRTHGNARILCRLVRAWKNKHAVKMNGLLVDTFVWRFMNEHDEYSLGRTLLYDQMLLDFFKYLAQLPKKEYWMALGSNQRVNVAKPFQIKAKKTIGLCQEAIDAEDTEEMAAKWRKVLGRFVPIDDVDSEKGKCSDYVDTEEFIEDFHPIDISFELALECEVTQDGFRPKLLADMLKMNIPLFPKKRLHFKIQYCNVPEPYTLLWKVLNRGKEAEKRNCVRGQIIDGKERNGHIEHTQFKGERYVECYVVKDGVVVAKARQVVPIEEEN